MNRKYHIIILSKIKRKRAQLNISEVVFSASIILLLSVSIGRAGVYLSDNQSNSLDDYEDLSFEILRETDELGFLRPFIYDGIDSGLSSFLNIRIDKGDFYFLFDSDNIGRCTTNSDGLLCSQLSSIKQPQFQSSIFLGGYFSNTTSDSTNHIAILVLVVFK